MASRYTGTPKEKRALDTFVKFVRSFDSIGKCLTGKDTLRELSMSQFGTLEMLYHLGPLNQKDIGEKLLISKSNVVGVIDHLESAGWAKRIRNEEDRRVIFVHLTPAGTDTIEEILPVHVGAITDMLSCLTAAEQDELGRLCKKLGTSV